MRATLKAMWAAAGFALVSGQVLAQPPERGGGGAPGGGALNPAQLIEKLKGLDANKDGKISKDEVKDERLQRLFERMDADKNGEVTKEEMEKLIGQMGVVVAAVNGMVRGAAGVVDPLVVVVALKADVVAPVVVGLVVLEVGVVAPVARGGLVVVVALAVVDL